MAFGHKRISCFFCALALALGLVIGWFGGQYFSKNDTFELVGEKEYFVELNSEDFLYEEEGVRIIEFGRDISDKVSFETNMTTLGDGKYNLDTTVPGRYYIKYTVASPRYGEICRIRIFTVGEVNTDG